MGYHLAGFDVFGVDIKPQPNYPFWFRQADALEFPLEGFDVIHASPPCQGYSDMAKLTKREYPLLIDPIRFRLRNEWEKHGTRYIIENVESAPLIEPVLMCGVERGLRLDKYVLRRHRLFESNMMLYSDGCACHPGDGITMAVYGGGNTSKPPHVGSQWRTPVQGHRGRTARDHADALGDDGRGERGNPASVHAMARRADYALHENGASSMSDLKATVSALHEYNGKFYPYKWTCVCGQVIYAVDDHIGAAAKYEHLDKYCEEAR